MIRRVRALVDRISVVAVDGSAALDRHASWRRRWYTPVATAVMVLLAIVAVFHVEQSGPNFDPQYMRVLVERTMRFGGSYYRNGIHNKGPLEPFVYEVAGRIGGPDGWWFALAVLTLVASCCVGAGAAIATRISGGGPVLGACAASTAVTHLMLSDADYAGVLYARNMIVALLCVAFTVVLSDAAWTTPRRRLVAVLVVGVAIGLAVQTLVTACFTASPVLLWAMWSRRDRRVGRVGAWLAMPVVAAAAFLSAPAYYRIFGPWRDFADGWWVYGRFMSSATGRSLGSQIDLGWTQLFEYYRDRPVLLITIQLWIVVTALRWRRLDRTQQGLRVVIGCWFLGAWTELAVSQRYSSHYFSVVAVPSILMIATLVGDIAPRVRPALDRRPAAALLPVMVAAITLVAGGTSGFDVGVEAASVVTDTHQFAQRRSVGIDGRTEMVAATLDVVSRDGDPLLMWTSYPWPYLDLHRVSATRYIWKSFLLGEIYLAGTSEDYVLPGTWERFESDLEHTDPTAFLVQSVNPVAPDTPFADAVAARFTTVFHDDVATLALRNDLAAWLTAPPVVDVRALVVADGSNVVADHSCTRLDLDLDVTDAIGVRFDFGDDDRAPTSIAVTLGVDAVSVESNRYGRAGWSVRSELDGASTHLTLVAGARAALVAIDGRVTGAVTFDGSAPVVRLTGAMALVANGDVAQSDVPAWSGC
ncbi:MAG: hypothetical protein ABIO83_02830 [Ilumatobacteraceae bacterium]